MRGPQRSTPHGETPYSPTSLLRALTADPYGVDALREHEDPRAEAAPPDNRATRSITLVLAILLGFAVAVAVADLRADAVAEDSPRALLEQEVLDSREEIDDLENRQEVLEGEIGDAQGEVLDKADSGASERLAAYESAGAGVAMSGPGVVLSLDDSVPLPSSPGVDEGTVNRVTDGDLQRAVNGLWAAGAEAIAVNGQRLSTSSAIRTAGSAVLVDFRPLSPPYGITALGDPETLRSAVDAGETGDYLSEISARFGIRTSWDAGEELTVPARAVGTLREASVLEPEREGAPEALPTAEPATGPVPEDETRKESE
ncbi:DUF881 domain-containing protein [Brachybacterium sp. FME24]|uniref:DUF881 domain-containing protein n=1 Tax=Brachybacterium sp. FME24 TaxID=2742605 RepID=UPI0018676283|nr:DUF881 domain-containing protein [Brachybacterium sp. FME24]